MTWRDEAMKLFISEWFKTYQTSLQLFWSLSFKHLLNISSKYGNRNTCCEATCVRTMNYLAMFFHLVVIRLCIPVSFFKHQTLAFWNCHRNSHHISVTINYTLYILIFIFNYQNLDFHSIYRKITILHVTKITKNFSIYIFQ